VMPLPEDESQWEEMYAIFATMSGNVRRNRLSDFTNIKSNGKIAMKLDEGDRLVAVRTCLSDEDIILATAKGGCIRFRADDVRVFVGRNSTGVRGIRLAKDDSVIAMSKLTHIDTDTETRDTYLRAVYAKRRLSGLDQDEVDPEKRQEDEARAAVLVEEPYRSMEENEEYLLTISDAGYGLLTSAYDYRVTGRGGKGIGNMDLGKAEGSQVIASFPIRFEDELVLVTDGGQLIRVGVDEISPKRRNGMGVRVFDVGDEQKVVSVAHMSEREDEDDLSDEVPAEAPGEGDQEPPADSDGE